MSLVQSGDSPRASGSESRGSGIGMKIHPTAVVDPKARIAEGVEIGPYCVVGSDVEIGAGTRLLDHVTVVGRTTIGRDNTVHPYAVIGGTPQDLKYRGEDTELVIGNRNTIREHVTINIGTAGGGGVTRIGDSCLLMAGCHVAHDCELGSRVIVANNVLLAGHVRLEDGSALSGMVALHHFVTIGRQAYVAGFSRVNVDVPPFMVAHGIPLDVVKVNTVGLRRLGFGEDTLAALKEAHRLLWRSGLPKPEAMSLVEQRYPDQPEVRILLDFLRATDRGHNGRAREAMRRPAPDEEPDEETRAEAAS